MKKIIQFGYSLSGQPEGVPVVDCRCIPNPFPKHLDKVAARFAVRSDPSYPKLVDEAVRLLLKNDTVAIGCGYGVHRSGEVVRAVVDWFRRNTAHEITVDNRGKA